MMSPELCQSHLTAWGSAIRKIERAWFVINGMPTELFQTTWGHHGYPNDFGSTGFSGRNHTEVDGEVRQTSIHVNAIAIRKLMQ
jgi:hypothetical protein